ncbi:MAG: Holliday junction branch migration protein RuvA, partial [Oscillibacter sp.]|nr:Holliday junction branch migration protein RuvA [Oscillibacter sp.]
MFYYLDGTVAEILPYLAVIDCGGVGYACKTTNNTLSRLKKGQKGRVYTYLNVGEGIFDLYGFATQNELNSFKLLLGVSGVGPKAALAILSVGTPETLAMAIVTGDEKALTAAPGIGKKIAQRIILELKD